MPYCGTIDWEDFASSLKEIGFDGVFSLETLPPARTPCNIFEDLSKVQAKIARQITKSL